MRRSGRGEHDDLGDILGRQRANPAVDVLSSAPVAAEADLAELGLDHARVYRAHADSRTIEIQAQRLRERPDRGLARAVHVAAGVGLVSGDGPDVDHRTPSPFQHSGQHGPIYVQQALDVGVDHLVPVLELAGGQWIESPAEAGVVDQDLDRLPVLRQLVHRAEDVARAAYVESRDSHLSRAQFP